MMACWSARTCFYPPENGADSWRIVEVKASTKVKPEHIQDCAIQAWVHLGAGHPLDSISLAHIDNQFVYRVTVTTTVC